MTRDRLTERKAAIIQLQQGRTIEAVAESVNRSVGWVAKWKQRYEAEGWSGLKERSRRPKHLSRETPIEVKATICRVRMELEAEAELGQGLKYIGGRAIRTRLKQEKMKPLPSIATIERVISAAGLTKSKAKPDKAAITYPRLHPSRPHQLTQVDIVPHFLQGGQRVACFNSIDVVSRYPTGQAFEQRRSQDAAEFLIHSWQTVGWSEYTQVDNEGCFSGGTTHPYVLGKVVRLALYVGTQLLFSPYYHPQSNGFIERFHADYSDHVWAGTYLADLEAVNQQAKLFFTRYRQREDHTQLNQHTPDALHHQQPYRQLDRAFQMPTDKLPLRPGLLHFMRQVQPNGLVRVLNVDWPVPQVASSQGVWVTLALQPTGSTLTIFDTAPDASQRQVLAAYPFPLKEPVLPLAQGEEVVTTLIAARLPSAQLSASVRPPHLAGSELLSV